MYLKRGKSDQEIQAAAKKYEQKSSTRSKLLSLMKEG